MRINWANEAESEPEPQTFILAAHHFLILGSSVPSRGITQGKDLQKCHILPVIKVIISITAFESSRLIANLALRKRMIFFQRL